MNEKIDLLEEVKNLSKESKILFTSYTFHQTFFEKYLFPSYKNKMHPLVLIDYRDYINNVKRGNSRNVETRYFLGPINITGSFHPKVVVACDDTSLKLIVGSSNLTHNGYAANAEINGIIQIDYANNPFPGILTSLREFLEETANIIKSDPHKKKIIKFRDLIPEETINENDSVWFLHNFKYAIINQILEKVGTEIEEVIVVSPFFSQGKEFYELFFKTFKCPVSFVVQKSNNNVPIEILESFQDKKIIYKTISFDEKRNLHAKILLIKTKRDSYCLFGSPNFTLPALVLTPGNGGNVEACILRRAQDPNFFDYIFKDEQLKIKDASLKSIDSVHIPFPSKESFDFIIEEATITDDLLVIKLDKQIDEPFSLVVHIDSLDEDIIQTVDSSTIKIRLTDDQLEKMKNSSVLSLVLKSGDKSFTSDMKWVHNPQHFPEKFSILNSIADRDEAKWLFSLLSRIAKIPSLSYIIPILNEMNDMGFFDISGTYDKEEKIKKLNRKIEKLAGRKERLKNVIEKFVDRHERRMDKAINSKLQANSKIAVDSFIMINKLVLWSVINEYEDITYLRKIRANFEKLINYFKSIDKTQIIEILSNPRFMANLIIQIYLVDRLQIKSPKFKERDSDFWVKRVFEDTFSSSLRYILNSIAKSIDVFSIDQFKDEYEFINKDIELTDDDVRVGVKKICPNI